MTRAAILEAATRRFACQGYEHSGLREIAADAGVTAALVNRYFGSKEGLFAEVIEQAFNIRYLIEGDRATLAERLARVMVYGREDTIERDRIPLLLMLRSATEPQAAEMIRTSLDRNNLRQLAECLEGPDAEIRATMIIAQLTGFAIMYQMLRTRALAEAEQERLVVILARSLEIYINQ
ncbi:TetR family transcriptional regulator [Singulisphaera sp. PoT]|uniref:TetR/AcrR family transcriptional regulator n=1 Tax=Singulisphaera sp. PoT TaxID=3411797 RepID=UPI003BF4D737